MTALNDLVALGEPRRYPERIAALKARVAELEAQQERAYASGYRVGRAAVLRAVRRTIAGIGCGSDPCICGWHV